MKVEFVPNVRVPAPLQNQELIGGYLYRVLTNNQYPHGTGPDVGSIIGWASSGYINLSSGTWGTKDFTNKCTFERLRDGTLTIKL